MALQPMVGKGNYFEGSLSLFGIARLLACCSLNIFFVCIDKYGLFILHE